MAGSVYNVNSHRLRPFSIDHREEIYNVPGPDSRNDPLAIGSDTILWSWSTDRIPQTPITIGSSDRETTKPSSLSPIESWHKSFTIERGLNMPCLTGMCMWLTSLKIYKLLTQDRSSSSKYIPVVCGFNYGDITDKMTYCCDEISDPTPIHVASIAQDHDPIEAGSFVESDRIEKSWSGEKLLIRSRYHSDRIVSGIGPWASIISIFSLTHI